VPDVAERGTEASEPDSQRVEDNWHDINGLATPVASSASADAAGSDAAVVASEQPDDAETAADVAEVWQVLTVAYSHAPFLQRCPE
jgi:hypothetical protein